MLKSLAPTSTTAMLALPLMLLGVIFALALSQLSWQPSISADAGPETVGLSAAPFPYRRSGEFLQSGKPVDAPLLTLSGNAEIAVMKYQVLATDYAVCVADGACQKPDRRTTPVHGMPMTGVSFDDAQNYAAWLSAQTGQLWRLPTDEEWVFFAGSRFADTALNLAGDGANPAQRWLAEYAREVGNAGSGPVQPQIAGSHGENEYGIADVAGNVWEWTSTCHTRIVLDDTGAELSRINSCGVHVVEGRHRSAMSNFIRDARSGGCTAGTPPDNLGFRLVRETGWGGWLGAMAQRIVR